MNLPFERLSLLEQSKLGALNTMSYARDRWLTEPFECAVSFMRATCPDAALEPVSIQNAICNQSIICARWGLSGFPVLNLTHRLAATLMATSINEEALEDVRVPWHGVAVRIPTDLLYIEKVDGSLIQASMLFFTSYKDKENKERWCYSLNPEHLKNNNVSLWASHLPQEDPLSEDLPNLFDSIKRTSVDKRSELLARRLMIGLCLWCSDRKNLGEPRQTKQKRTGSGRDGSVLPSFKNWFLGRDIKIDDRVIGAIRDYAKEGGNSPRVQFLVAGHWKRQAHGPRGSLRKIIHVEPYWKGPLDAPVLDRSGSKEEP